MKVNINKHKLNYKKDYNICLISDIHISNKYNFNKLYRIKDKIDSLNIKYIFIAGDIFDYSNVDNNIKDKFILWIKELSFKYIIYIGLGNHDNTGYINNKRCRYLDINLWKDISNIKNVYVSINTPSYIDDYVCVNGLDLEYSYYKNHSSSKCELKKALCNHNFIYDKNKLNILVVHSPMFLSDDDIKKYLYNFDVILCGHMHNGCVLPILSKVIKPNYGIVSPGFGFFRDNCRGEKDILIKNKYVKLIICGGVVKLAHSARIYNYFNFLFPIDIDIM